MGMLGNLFGKKEDADVMVASGDGFEVEEKAKAPFSRYFYYGSFVFLLLTIGFTYGSTDSLFTQWERTFRQYKEAVKSQEAEQKNTIALKSLQEELENIQHQQTVIDQAIPYDPRYDQVVSYFEYLFNTISKENLMTLPDTFTWKEVLPDDVSNTDLQELQILEYPLEFKGDYTALLEFISSLRKNLRLIDIVQVDGLTLGEGGVVKAQFVVWAYNLFPS